MLKLNHRVFPSVVDSVQRVEALTSNVFGDRAQKEVSMVKRGHKRGTQSNRAPVLIKRGRDISSVWAQRKGCVQTE